MSLRTRSPHRRPATRLVLAISLTVLAACSGDDDATVDTDSQPSTTVTQPQESTTTTTVEIGETAGDLGIETTIDLEKKPVILLDGVEVPDELEIIDVVEGSGAEAIAGSFISARYVGVLHNGEQFDASWDRGSDFSFPLGAAQVIKGWDDGIAGMKVGGRRILSIPSSLAYGESGSGSGSIGPDEPLVFVVDLVGVIEVGEKPPVEVADPLPDGLDIVDEIEGDGAAVESGDSITVHYVGVSASTGEEFDASWDRGAPFTLQIGVGGVIPGWDEGLIGMKVGGQRRLTIPPDMAYGEAGAGGVIGPNETLVFVVNLLKVD